MGTQTSFNGQSDRPALLPKWALLPPDVPPILDKPIPDGVPAQVPKKPELPIPKKPDAVPDTKREPPKPAPTATPTYSWRSARGSLGKAVTAKGRGNSLRKAGRAYVRAMGGNRRAATSARSGRSSTSQLGGFLAAAATRGLSEALKEFKLSSLVGKDVDTVFAGLVNAIGPEGSSREEIAARDAISEALCFLYEKIAGKETDAAAAFSSLDEDMVREAMTISVTAYVYERWIVELGKRIEEKAITAVEAVKLEGQMKQYVRDAVKVEFQGKDILSTNWKAKEGRELVQRIFEDAYAFIGGSK